MDIVYKIALRVTIAIVILFFSLSVRSEVDETYVDSLRNVLEDAKTPLEKIPVLKKLSNLYWQQPQEVSFVKEVIDLSMQIDSIHIVYAGMAGLCRYYYNNSQLDSLIYWKNQLDSLCKKRSETPPVLFRVGNLLCRYYQGTLNYELAMSESFNLVNEARRAQDDYGQMLAYQSLGFVYQGIGRDSDAVVAFREGLIYLDKLEVPPAYVMEYMSEFILSCLHENLLDEAESLLNRFHEVYVSQYELFKKNGLVYHAVWHHWLMEAYYAELYMKKGLLDKAGTHIQEAEKYAEKSTEENMKFQYYRVKSMYCFLNKDYKRALETINKALQVETHPDFLKLKIDILRADNQKAAAMKIYDELFALNTRINDEAFNRQIQQLRTLNDLSDKEQQSYELKIQNEQLALRQQLLVMAILVAFVLLVLLSILFRYYLRTNRLKNALQADKDSLVKSEHQLRMAKNIAEEANLQKTAFVAKISHEVRTPLNAIVGFSRLLGDGSSEFSDEEKMEFADIISKNSTLLLHLVNDVLDFSRLDSGKVQLVVMSYDVIACCREVIRDMEPYVSSGVKLAFETTVDEYLLNTDILRFRRVLENLLKNAAKFTKAGEIKLSFEIDEANASVRLLVTDTGCGIPVEMQSRIFECFEKLDEFVQGAGLGLPISQRIATLLKGRLYVDPDYTAGARFVFVHPIGLQNDIKL